MLRLSMLTYHYLFGSSESVTLARVPLDSKPTWSRGTRRHCSVPKPGPGQTDHSGPARTLELEPARAVTETERKKGATWIDWAKVPGPATVRCGPEGAHTGSLRALAPAGCR